MLGKKINKIYNLIGVGVGDYCFASQYSDEDPNDPWSVGFVEQILIDKNGIVVKLGGDGVLDRWFGHFRKITSEEGHEIIAWYGQWNKK